MKISPARNLPDISDYHEIMAEMVGRWDARPKLVITPHCEIIWHSPSAPELLRDPSPVRIAGNRLVLANHISAGSVQRFFENATDAPAKCLLRARTKGHWTLLRAWSLDQARSEIGVVCTLSVPTRSVTETGLADELNLTPSEASVLDLFARLQKPDEIAGTMDISLSTVRSHMKQIFAKASVASGVQLLQLTRGYCSAG